MFVNFTIKDGLASNTVSAIHRDPDGVMWFGTFGVTGSGGVSRYEASGFVSFTTKDGLASNDVTVSHVHPDGGMWFGTRAGVSRYDGKGFVNFTVKDGLASNYIYTIHSAPDGTLWFGTFDDGLSLYDGKGFVNLTTKDGLVHNQVRALHGTNEGVIWIGTNEGVSRYNKLRKASGEARFLKTDIGTKLQESGYFITALTQKDGVGHHQLECLYTDPRGTLWIGMHSGLFRYDGKSLVDLTTTDGVASGAVRAIHGTPDGIICVGTGSGVSRYDGKSFVTFTTQDGLASNSARAIHCNRDGVMWVGTQDTGVSFYDGVAWTSLDRRDGLASNRITSIVEGTDGAMWFGTNEGITRYRRTKTPPGVRILSVKTDEVYTNLDAVPPITTGHRVTIAYSAIDLKTVPEKRQYRVRLLNPSGEPEVDWHVTKQVAFDYTLRKAGNYGFEVVAIDRDLNYSEPATLTLEVVRPWWVYAFAGLIIAGIPLVFLAFYVGKRLQTQRAIAQQFNPYIAGRVVGEDLFYGRSDLLTEVERTLANNCFLLYGERRIGKTSLQHQLRERLANADDPTYRFIPAYIDMQGVAEADFFRTIGTAVVEHAASLFRETLALRLNEDREQYTYRDLNRDLRAIIDHLKAGEVRTIKLVLLMDEIDTLNGYNLRTNLNLRGLFMGPLKENLVLVMSGLYLKMDWSEEGGGSPPFNFLSREIQVQPLREGDALKLIMEPVKGFYTYEPKAVDLIIELSELRPFVIQGFCLRAVNRILADGRTRITVADIEAIKDSVLGEVASIRGERAGTSLPVSLNEALSRIAEMEAELARLQDEAA